MNIARTEQELDIFLESVIEKSNFSLKEVEISEQEEWYLNDGVLSHRTGGFFDVIGVEQNNGKEHLLMYQPQSALTGLAICKSNNDIYILLQARIEPGNTGIGQYGPTIQSTPANYFALHGGKKTSILNLFYGYDKLSTSVGTSMQLDLGERYFHKSKWHNYVILENFHKGAEHMIWVSLKILRKRVFADNYLNADLRSLLSVFNWNKLFKVHLAEMENFNKSDVLNNLLERRNSYKVDFKLKPLSELNNWKITQNGIESEQEVNPLLKMYFTSCITREVASWYQPLIQAQSNGLVILKTRKVNNHFEYLVTISKEIGLESGYQLTTTTVINPGESLPDTNQDSIGEILYEFLQSDEGGRFYKHQSLYQVILVSNKIKNNSNQCWISLYELKRILSLSNIASFQLRCISSLLIFDMNDSLDC